MILGMVGWRGMVGSVLTNRMREEHDFDRVQKVIFFSTSAAGKPAPDLPNGDPVLADGNSVEALSRAAITPR